MSVNALPDAALGDSDAAENRGRGRSRRRAQRDTELHLLRLIPGDTAMHRLWAGTKLVGLAILSIAATIHPSWITLAAVAIVIAAGMIVARIPRGAAPRLPTWFVVFVLFGGFLSVWSTAPPTVSVQGIVLSLGGLEDWARFLLLAVVLVTGAALIGWTTPAGELAPALSRLVRPFRWLPLPIDEWLVAIALSLRCFPLLVDEIRTLVAVRRLRGRLPDGPRRRSIRRELHAQLREAIDLLTAALVASLRRAREMADAIEARGGFGAFADSHDRPRMTDWFVIVVVTTVAAGTIWFG
jgi:energy-coupling factor transporter transmembrane protein EcfT